MTRALAVTAALAAVLVAGCGGDKFKPVPPGTPAERHSQRAIDELTQVENVRWNLLLVGDLWGVRRGPEVLKWANEARRSYTPLSPKVRAKDPRLDAEILAAFDRIESRIEQGRSFDDVRDILARSRRQLLDGVTRELGIRDAAADPGVAAAVAIRLLPEGPS